MSTKTNHQHSTLYGILFMLINTVALALVDISSKTLGADMKSAHIVFFYKSFLFLAILPWVLSGGLKVFKTDKVHVHLIRSLLSVLGSMCFVTGLKLIPMADAAALENIQYILLVLIGMLFFKEKITKTKITAVIIGFIGAIIVVRPELLQAELSSTISNATEPRYYAYTFLAIMFWTLNTVSVKILGRTEKNRTQMFYLMLFACMWAAPFALIKWDTVVFMGLDLKLIPKGTYTWAEFNLQLWHLKFLVFMAICYFIHGIAYFNSLKSDLSVVSPFRYSKLIFSGLLGLWLFNEVPELASYYGYALIVVSGLVLLRAEARKAKVVRRTAAATSTVSAS